MTAGEVLGGLFVWAVLIVAWAIGAFRLSAAETFCSCPLCREPSAG